MEETYLFYTPIVPLEGGLTLGGAICIKTSVPGTVIGFASEALARECIALRNMNPGIQVISLKQLRRDDPEAAASVRTIVRFPDSATLHSYAAEPAAFPCEQYFVHIDPPIASVVCQKT